MSEHKHINNERIVDFLNHKLSGIHTGRVNSAILETIDVEAYGTKMKINELATVNIPEPTQLLITPFDKSVNSAIAKAITDSNLGVNPVDDGVGIRLNFPPLTEESRKNKVKIVNKLLEEAKVEVRKERQDILKKIKHQKDEGEIGEDEMKRLEDELQKETEKTNKELEDLAKKKEDELMKF